MKLMLFTLLFSFTSQAQLVNKAMLSEDRYDFYRKAIIDGSDVSTPDKKILVDALWDIVAEDVEGTQRGVALKKLNTIDFTQAALPEQLRLFLLGVKLQVSSSKLESQRTILRRAILGKLSKRSLIILFNHANTFRSQGLSLELSQVETSNATYKAEYDSILKNRSEEFSDSEIVDLLNMKRAQTVVYLACRPDRRFPCLILMKDKNGKFLLNQGKELFSLPALAHTRLKLPFHHENGETPAGVYFLDSVMPVADKQTEFGKNRRLILNIAGEAEVKKILPGELLKKNWWKEAQLANALGRGFLRVHGTGLINSDPKSTHPTLVSSVGCVKLREGKYGPVEYNDQRILLDQLMKLQGLQVKTANETNIRATLVLFHVQGTGPVQQEELKHLVNL